MSIVHEQQDAVLTMKGARGPVEIKIVQREPEYIQEQLYYGGIERATFRLSVREGAEVEIKNPYDGSVVRFAADEILLTVRPKYDPGTGQVVMFQRLAADTPAVVEGS